MSLLSLVFNEASRTKIQTIPRGGGPPFILEIDATTILTHDRSANPTKNPIEDGSLVTDHVTLDNNRLTIEGIISEHPLTLLQSLQTIASQSVLGLASELTGISTGILGGVGGSVGQLLFDDQSRPENAFRFLEEIHRNRLPFKIVTELGRYNSMILTKLSVPQSAQEGKSIRFSASFEEINIVTTQVVDVPVTTSEDTNHSSNKKTQAGQQEASDPSTSIQQDSSIALTIFRAIRNGQ